MVRGIGWALLGMLMIPAAQAQNAPAQTSPAQSVPAQTPPAQIGNIYGGTAHEPNPATTRQQEQSAGVGLSQQQQQQQTSTIEQLDTQVQQAAKMPLGARAGCSPNGKACPP